MDHDRQAVVLARVFTRDQSRDLISYILRLGPMALDAVEDVRADAAAVPPLLAPLDVAEEHIAVSDVDAYIQGLTAVVIDSMSSAYGSDDYERALGRIGIRGERASEAAERIAAPGSDTTIFALRVLRDLAPIADFLPGATTIAAGATELLLRNITNIGLARNFELVELGRYLREEATRAILSASYAMALNDFNAQRGSSMAQPGAEPDDDDDEDDPFAGVSRAIRDFSGESGSPPEQFNGEDLLAWLESLSLDMPSPYHTFAAAAPEQGGAFGRLVKRGLKKAFKVVKKALPMVASAAGSAFGGPAGGRIAGKLAGAVVGASRPGAGRGRRPERIAAQLVNPETLRAASRVMRA